MARVADKPKEMPVRPQQHTPLRFTVAQYERMFEMGMFEGLRVELLNGMVMLMPAMGDPHFVALGRLNVELVRKLGDRAFISQQSPIRVVEANGEPEPDFALTPLDVFEQKVPAGAAVGLVVEISDSTLKTDREVKLPIYARAGIPEAWIVNLKTKQLEVYTSPEGDQYRSKQTYDQGQAVTPSAFPDVQIEWW